MVMRNWQLGFVLALLLVSGLPLGKRLFLTSFSLQQQSLMSGQDTLVDVGTGYGKTLCMIIP